MPNWPYNSDTVPATKVKQATVLNVFNQYAENNSGPANATTKKVISIGSTR